MDSFPAIEVWVFWTLLAALMQSVRTAGQKHLASDITAMSATLVRYLFGLPFALLYLGSFIAFQDHSIPELNSIFLLSGALAGVLQIVATVLLVRLFTLRNFAVGTTYAKTEIVLTAIIGSLFFTEVIPWSGWAGIVICVIGVLMINAAKTGGIGGFWNQSAIYGLASGLSFALTSLFLRQASLSFGLDEAAFTAALTLAYMVTLQTLICLAMVAYRDRGQFLLIAKRWRPSLFVGITSVAGSVGWFTAMTLERASYVKTLGQVEFLFTVIISLLFFKERPTRLEWAGMAVVMLSVIVLLLSP